MVEDGTTRQPRDAAFVSPFQAVLGKRSGEGIECNGIVRAQSGIGNRQFQAEREQRDANQYAQVLRTRLGSAQSNQIRRRSDQCLSSVLHFKSHLWMWIVPKRNREFH